MVPRLTKIMATLGPATGRRATIRQLVAAGVNLFRLNLSHGSHEEAGRWIHWIREVEREQDIFVGILLDLQGPKIRVGKFEQGSIHLRTGQRVVFTTAQVTGNARLVPVQYSKFHKEVSVGDHVYLDDGNLWVQVQKIEGRQVEVEVKVGGNLSDHKGINLPDAAISAGPMTAKDKDDLVFGLNQGVDFVALSFVKSAKDIVQLRQRIRKLGGRAEIIAKIERKQAVERIVEIVGAADGVMVARGDLGIEIPLAEVPVVQIQILQECALQFKPVIVATQMLESMVHNNRPTRAEVSDISQAVRSGADAVMLSAETAVGQHPEEAVKVMVDTALKTETHQRQTQRILPWSWYFDRNPPVGLGITYAANRLVELLNAQALVVFTETGQTARHVAGPRPTAPLFVFTRDKERARKLTLLRGAVPFLIPARDVIGKDLTDLFRMLKRKRLVKKKDRVVITAGILVGKAGGTNIIRVEEVP